MPQMDAMGGEMAPNAARQRGAATGRRSLQGIWQLASVPMLVLGLASLAAAQGIPQNALDLDLAAYAQNCATWHGNELAGG